MPSMLVASNSRVPGSGTGARSSSEIRKNCSRPASALAKVTEKTPLPVRPVLSNDTSRASEKHESNAHARMLTAATGWN